MESSSDQFKLALCQITVTTDKETNLIRARKMLEQASDLGAKLAVLPIANVVGFYGFVDVASMCEIVNCAKEMWVCPFSHEYFSRCAEDFDEENQSPAYSMMSNVAFSKRITIVGGSLPELRKGKLYNTCCVFGPDGKLIAKHSKLHLFDYDAGDASFRESDSVTAGDIPTVVDTDVGRIGIGICHDIRFPELAMLYKRKGVVLIIYPGAFNISTGKMLWELETKARAVDNQLFVAVCSPSRDSNGSYTVWGYSMIVTPSGEVIASAEQDEKLVIAEINLSKNQLQKESFALQIQDKDEIYRFLSIQT